MTVSNIGSHVVEKLRASGRDCIVIDNLSTGHKESLLGATLYLADIQNTEVVEKIFEDYPEIESAIHFAGSIIVPESVENPIKYYENNFANSLKFLNTAMKCGLKNIIFSSTAAVYGEKVDGVCFETDVPKPMNPYGHSKLMFEQLLQDLDHINKLRFIALRYFNVAGASSSGKLGQKSKQSTHLLKIASETACGKREKMSIYGDDYPTPDGTCIRDFIHIEDLATAHLKALDYLEKENKSHIINCGYGKGTSVKEVINELKVQTSIDFNVEVSGRRAGDAHMLISNADKIREILDWTPEFDDLGHIVKSAFEYEKSLN